MGKSSPKAPDYVGAAQQQGQANISSAIAQAILNNPNKTTPFGNFTNKQTGTQRVQTGTTAEGGKIMGLNIGGGPGAGGQPIYSEIPTFTQEFELNPGVSGAVNNLYSTLSKPFDPSNPSAYESAYMKRLEPQLERARDAKITDMSVRGFKPGSTAYETERNIMGQQENDARSQAVTNGLQFDIAARNQPINEITALMNGTQVGVPQFQGAGIGAPNVLGAQQAQGQAMMDDFNAWQAQRTGVTSAAAMGAMYAMSDRRMKKNIERVGATLGGYPLYLFHYISESDEDIRHVGVMADEVPVEWTAEHNGVRYVDYGRVR